jgi:hypothetical protein
MKDLKRKKKFLINLRYYRMHKFYKEKQIEQGQTIIKDNEYEIIRRSFLLDRGKCEYLNKVKTVCIYMRCLNK